MGPWSVSQSVRFAFFSTPRAWKVHLEQHTLLRRPPLRKHPAGMQQLAVVTAGGVASAGNSQELGPSESLTALETTLSACSGAAITTLFVTPFDVVKTRLQIKPNQGPECACCSSLPLGSQVLRIVRHEGVRSLWSGLQPTLLMQVPGTVLYFTAYETARNAVAARSPQSLQEYAPLVAGGGARLVTSTVVSPLELMRTRMQAEQALLRQGMLGGALALVRREGVAALWKGLAPTLWRDVPEHGQSAPLAAPQLAPCAPSGRAWRLWAARHSQSEAQPLGAQPRPWGLKQAASTVADCTAFDYLGALLDGILAWLRESQAVRLR